MTNSDGIQRKRRSSDESRDGEGGNSKRLRANEDNNNSISLLTVIHQEDPNSLSRSPLHVFIDNPPSGSFAASVANHSRHNSSLKLTTKEQRDTLDLDSAIRAVLNKVKRNTQAASGNTAGNGPSQEHITSLVSSFIDFLEEKSSAAAPRPYDRPFSQSPSRYRRVKIGGREYFPSPSNSPLIYESVEPASPAANRNQDSPSLPQLPSPILAQSHIENLPSRANPTAPTNGTLTVNTTSLPHLNTVADSSPTSAAGSSESSDRNPLLPPEWRTPPRYSTRSRQSIPNGILPNGIHPTVPAHQAGPRTPSPPGEIIWVHGNNWTICPNPACHDIIPLDPESQRAHLEICTGGRSLDPTWRPREPIPSPTILQLADDEPPPTTNGYVYETDDCDEYDSEDSNAPADPASRRSSNQPRS